MTTLTASAIDSAAGLAVATPDNAAGLFPAASRGWHDDPTGLHALRFHDGGTWTAHTTHFGPVPCQGGCRPGR